MQMVSVAAGMMKLHGQTLGVTRNSYLYALAFPAALDVTLLMV